MSLSELFAVLGSAPHLPGALCRGRVTLFDAVEDPQVNEAVALCQQCPALRECSEWARSLPADAFAGVVAGQVHTPIAVEVGPEHLGEATTPGRVAAFVNSRRQTCAGDLSAIGITQPAASVYLHRLAKAGRIRKVGRGQYSGLPGMRYAEPHVQLCGRPTARQRPCRRRVDAAGQACEFHGDASVEAGA